MYTKMKIINPLVFLIVGMSFCPLNLFAESEKNHIDYDGYKYNYKKVVVRFNDLNEATLYGGLITVIDRNNNTIYKYKTDLPGCNGFPAISLFKYQVKKSAISKEKVEENFVLFCGNSGGPHQVLKIFSPDAGVIASLDFMRGNPDINYDQEGNLFATVVNEIYITALSRIVPYSTIYKLDADASTFAFSSNLGKELREQYIRSNKYKYEIFRKSSNQLYAGIDALIGAAIIGDEETYKKIYKLIDQETNGKALNIEEDINSELDFN